METHTRLKELRNALDLSVSQLAEQAGVTPGYIHQIERGERGERLATPIAIRLAKVLGVTVEDLFATTEATDA